MKLTKKEFIERIYTICQEHYGRKDVEVKRIPLPLKWAKGYYLTDQGDTIIFKDSFPKGKFCKGKNDTIQFYQNSKRVFWLTRRKLMMMTFEGLTLAQVRSVKVFPKNGKKDDVRFENLINFESVAKGHAASYDNNFQRRKTKLSTRQVLQIKKAKGKSTRRELSERYQIGMRQITRIWNNHTYKHLLKIN